MKSVRPAPLQLSLFPEATHLVRINPAKNERRFYHLSVETDLLGQAILLRGRIGRTGQEKIIPFSDAGRAAAELTKITRAKRRRGYTDLN
jgi:predicted DNA-binding WGR domain protein